MSLKSVGSKIKSGAKDLTSQQGLKSAAIWTGIGASLGVLASLILRYIQLFVVNKYAADLKYVGFSIYPNSSDNTFYLEDAILILLSVAMLLTKKLWLTVGFTLGWYGSNYLGFYKAMSLPEPTG